MIRPQLAAAILDLAYAATTPREIRRREAHEIVLRAVALAEIRRPTWWRWTCWLAAGITIRRIESL